MPAATVPPHHPGLVLRVLYRVPVLGRILREVSQDITNLFYLLVVLVTLEVLAFRLWGPVVLTLSALALVPLMFLFFVVISWPLRPRGADAAANRQG